jgi:hypothetical protein
MNTNTKILASFDLDGVLYDMGTAMDAFHDMKFDHQEWDFGHTNFRPLFEQFRDAGGFGEGPALIDSNRIGELIDAGVVVIYTTARSERNRPETQAWLDANGFIGQLYMSDWKGVPTTIYPHGEFDMFGVDDRDQNVKDIQDSGMDATIVRANHNAEWRSFNPDVRAVDNVGEFCEFILKLANDRNG